jgi:hypothetical protein
MSTSPSSDDGRANTLVLAPAFEAQADEACADMLGAAGPAETDALFMTLSGSPDVCLGRWRSGVSLTRPANIGIVSVDDSTRSAAATASVQTGANGHVRTVSSPGDLTGLGIAVSEFLGDWHGDGNETVVCFDSITTLLQYADLQRAFRFLHVLTQRSDGAGAHAHFHMDPTAHDEQTIRTITSLFDEVVEETTETADAPRSD